jgi:hypothetical protein
MFPLGDGRIEVSPELLVVQATLVASIIIGICAAIIRWLLRQRAALGANLALKEVKREFPDDAVQSSTIEIEDGQRYAYLTMTSGHVYKYLLIPNAEAAIRQRKDEFAMRQKRPSDGAVTKTPWE